MFRSLVKLRRNDDVFSLQGEGGLDGAVLSDHAFVLRFFGPASDRLLIVNFGADLLFTPCPEPLLAPLPGCHWRVLFSSEDPRFGGSGTAPLDLDQGWRIPAESALVLTCESNEASSPVPPSYDESVQEKSKKSL
jgi:maltooligosyltrehalose trehalohydrolase